MLMQQSDGPPVVGCCVGGIVCCDYGLNWSSSQIPKSTAYGGRNAGRRVRRSEFYVRVRVNLTVKKIARIARQMERFESEMV
jgi:hypothetical protein